jgi:ribosomal protein S12 methylthiotransferase
VRRVPRRLAVCEGFSLHADTSVHAHDRPGLERMCRYGSREIMAIQKRISREQNKRFVGQRIEVLVEGPNEESEHLLVGRHESQAPEIDGLVYINDGMAYPGELVTVEVTQAHHYDLVGKVVDRPDPKKRRHKARPGTKLPVIAAPR